jgi:hypothetical protein
MPPKAAVPQQASDSDSSSEDEFEENRRIRQEFENFKAAARVAKDRKRDAPPLKKFAEAAWSAASSRSVDAIYALYRRAIEHELSDPIATMGRPSKAPNALQAHVFATVAVENVFVHF